MANEEFVQRAAQIALDDAREAVIIAQRNWEDANRYQDETGGAVALATYVEAKARYDALNGGGSNQQQNNNSGQLSEASRRFLEKRVGAGWEITPARWAELQKAHHAAVGAGIRARLEFLLRCSGSSSCGTSGKARRRCRPQRPPG